MNSLACTLAVLIAGIGSPSTPGRDLEVTLQDDALVLHRSPSQVFSTTRQIRSLGATRLRVTAGWSVIAPAPRSRKRPLFDASNPADYPQEGWLKLDRAVKAANAAGLDVQIDVAFWAPRWAVRRKVAERDRQRWEPRAIEYARFSEAVAKRYSGNFGDPSHPGSDLPPVRLWTTWNEPNQATFLLPQWKRAGTQLVPASPHTYRKLHNAGYDAIKGVSGENKVLIGGLAAIGSQQPGERRNMAPLLFLRELACVDASMRPLNRPSCRGFKPLKADGFSHHPYSFGGPPNAINPDPDSASLGDLDRLADHLKELARRGRIAGELPLYLTEYGYETNPPDQHDGVSLEDQGRFIGHASYLAWQRKDVRMFSQFLLRDIGPDGRYGPRDPRRFHDYQTGLLYDDGRREARGAGVQAPVLARGEGGRRPARRLRVRPGAAGRRAPPDGDRGQAAGPRLGADVVARDPRRGRQTLLRRLDRLPDRRQGDLPARASLRGPRRRIPPALDPPGRHERGRGSGEGSANPASADPPAGRRAALNSSAAVLRRRVSRCRSRTPAGATR